MPTDDKDLLMRRVAAYLAVIIVLGFFGIMVLSMFHEVPTTNKDSVTQMQGALILAFGGLMGYLYGSSKSADATNRAMAAAIPPAPLATPAAPTTPDGTPIVKVDSAVPVAVTEVSAPPKGVPVPTPKATS
jgi:hypothetical protein